MPRVELGDGEGIDDAGRGNLNTLCNGNTPCDMPIPVVPKSQGSLSDISEIVIDGTQVQSLILSAINPFTLETIAGRTFNELRDELTFVQSLIRSMSLVSFIAEYTDGPGGLNTRNIDPNWY